MECLQNYRLNYKINSIVKKFVKKKQFCLYYALLKNLIKEELKIQIKKKLVKKEDECIICYKNKKYFYNFKCCNNSGVCIDCFSILLNEKFKCVICRKSLLQNLVRTVNNNIHLKLYGDEIRKKHILKKKRSYLKKINLNTDIKNQLITQLKLNGNEQLFNHYGFNLNRILGIEFLDFNFFKIVWFINQQVLETYLNIKNNILYFECGGNVFIKFNNFI